MLKAFLILVLVFVIVAVCVALMGPTFVALVAVDTSPEGIGIFLDLVQ